MTGPIDRHDLRMARVSVNYLISALTLVRKPVPPAARRLADLLREFADAGFELLEGDTILDTGILQALQPSHRYAHLLRKLAHVAGGLERGFGHRDQARGHLAHH